MGKVRSQTKLKGVPSFQGWPSSTPALPKPSGRVTKAYRPPHNVGNVGLRNPEQLEAYIFGLSRSTVLPQYNSIASVLSTEMSVGPTTGHPEGQVDMLCRIMESKWKPCDPHTKRDVDALAKMMGVVTLSAT